MTGAPSQLEEVRRRRFFEKVELPPVPACLSTRPEIVTWFGVPTAGKSSTAASAQAEAAASTTRAKSERMKGRILTRRCPEAPATSEDQHQPQRADRPTLPASTAGRR